MTSNYDNSQNVLTFEELLISNKDLCEVEPDEEQVKVVKPDLKKKKVINNSYFDRQKKRNLQLLFFYLFI